MHAVGAGADRPYATAEAPAVVDLLLHRWGPTYAAPAATLLDLVARGHLELVSEPSGMLVGRAPSVVRPEPLTQFEEVLLRQVIGRLAGGSAPAPALLPYPRDQDAIAWYATFRAKVIDEARRMGLVRDHFPLFGRRLTPAGRAAAGRWVAARSAGPTAAARWPRQAGAALDDRSLAWAVALGAATDLRRAVTPPAGPVWSPAGGRWHLVRVPWRPRGRAPRWARAHPERVSGSSTFTGLVIRRWTVSSGTEYATYQTYNVAVDDGALARAWRLPSGEYAKFATGDTVRVTIDHRGRLVEMVRWPGGAAAAGAAPGTLGSPSRTGGKGTMALGLGIASLLLCWLPVVGLVGGIVGLIAGIRSLGTATHGRAVAGIVTSSLALVVNVAVSALLVIGLAADGSP